MMLHDSRNLHQRKAACSSRVVISSHWRAFEGWQARLSPVPQKQKKDHRQGLPRHCFSLRSSSSEGFTAELCQSLVPAHTIRTRLLLCIPFSAPLNPVQCLWTEFGWWFWSNVYTRDHWKIIGKLIKKGWMVNHSPNAGTTHIKRLWSMPNLQRRRIRTIFSFCC